MTTTDSKLQAVRHAWRTACMSGPGLLLGILAPKCPLCAAVWLSSLGVGGTLAAQLAPWMKPVALLMAAGGLLLLLAAAARVMMKPKRKCCGDACASGLPQQHLP